MKHLASLSRIVASNVLLFLLVSCGGGQVEEVAFVPLAGDIYGDWPIKTYVLRTDAEWEAAWLEHTPFIISPRPTRPVVDFQKNVLLGVSRGWGPSGCNSIAITKVIRDGDTHVVEYLESKPAGTVLCAAVEVPLIAFVLVPPPVLNVTFKEAQNVLLSPPCCKSP